MAGQPLDLIIIGAGIGGVMVGKYAKQAGLNFCILEKANDVGGLWRDLPPWQDIQTRKEDWTLGSLPIASENQPGIHKNIKAMADEAGLSSHIRLAEPVTKAEPPTDGRCWRVHTPKGQYQARHVVVATGGHSRPFVPDVEIADKKVTVMHSSQLRDQKQLRGKKVTIVGGGASAYDLLDLAIKEEAAEIHWVYRSLTWMIPTSKSKHEKGEVRFIAKMQMLGAKRKDLNDRLAKVLPSKYKHFKIAEIMPDEPLNMAVRQVIPGRPLMVKHFDRITRHRGEVSAVAEGKVQVGSDSFETDILLFATGYEVDLSYLGLEAFKNIRKPRQLAERTGAMMKLLDYPNMYVVGIAMADSMGTAPWSFSVYGRTIVSHILGKCTIPDTPEVDNVVHFDGLKLAASFDRGTYPFWWRLKYILFTWWYHRHPDRILPYL